MKIIVNKNDALEKWVIDIDFNKSIRFQPDDEYCIGFTLCQCSSGRRTTIEEITGCNAEEVVNTLIRDYGAVIEFDSWGNRVPCFETEAEAQATIPYIEELLVIAQLLENAGALGLA